MGEKASCDSTIMCSAPGHLHVHGTHATRGHLIPHGMGGGGGGGQGGPWPPPPPGPQVGITVGLDGIGLPKHVVDFYWGITMYVHVYAHK